MSTPSSPTVQPAEIPVLVYPPSPQPLMVPPRLEDCLEDPPTPLTLEEHLGDPAPEEVPVPDSLTAVQPQTPEGYVWYDPTDPNHVRHVRKIHLHCAPHDIPQLPHYVCFMHDMGLHQHYVYSLMNDEEPPVTPCGWPLEVKPFNEPIPHLDTLLDNSALGIFNALH